MGGLEAKIHAATAMRIKLFFYPDDEKIDFAKRPIPVLPVKDLGQAMTFAQLAALDLPAAPNFRLYYVCLQDSELMLDNFYQIPPSLLLWARDRGLLAKLGEQTGDSQGFARLLDRLSDSVLSLEQKKVLASLLGEERLRLLPHRGVSPELRALRPGVRRPRAGGHGRWPAAQAGGAGLTARALVHSPAHPARGRDFGPGLSR